MTVTINVLRDTATPMAAAVLRAVGDRKATNRVAANAALPVFQKNFRQMALTNRNAFGIRSTFWNRMVSGTFALSSSDAGIIRMPREIALRYFGGTVKAKQSKFLAIPARSEAYGKSPRDFNDLRFALLGGKTPVLIQALQQAILYGPRRKKGPRQIKPGAVKGGGVFYWLKDKVTINGNDDVLPDQEDVNKAVANGLEDYFNRAVRRRAA